MEAASLQRRRLTPHASGLPERPAAAVGSFSQAQRANWERLVESPWVLDTVLKGYRLQFRRRPPLFRGVRVTALPGGERGEVLRLEISSLLAKAAVRRLEPTERLDGFYSTYFVVPKKDGGWRPILDLRVLNRSLRTMTFRMLSPARVLKAVSSGQWFTTLDLKDAYFHIPIHPRFRKFLRFAFQGEAYEYRVLPFGLSLAPRTFTKCMDAVLAPLSMRGVQVLNYLDDWLICAASREQVVRDTDLVLHHLQDLGLSLNLRKSCLNPSQEVVYLGMRIDASLMRASLPQVRVDTILSLLDRFRLGWTVSAWECQRLIGLLVAASLLVPLGLLYVRPVQRWYNSHRLHPKLHRHRRLLVTRVCLRALSRWRSPLYLTAGTALFRVACRELVLTDASLTGWGAVYRGTPARGLWRPPWLGQHISVLELRAVFLALKAFLHQLEGRHVLVRSDNTAVVAYVNHQGGLRSHCLHRLARDLLVWAHTHLLSLRAAFIPGSMNIAADILSRAGPPDGDWHLHPQVVQQLWDRFGTAQVDLFASRDSTHCPSFFSMSDPAGPLGLDALAHEWPMTKLYAFPPFPLIQATLDRVKRRGHQLLLVSPCWPRRPWFTVLLSMVSGTPWPLPQRPDLLSQASGTLFHPDPGRLRLWAWPLNGFDGRPWGSQRE